MAALDRVKTEEDEVFSPPQMEVVPTLKNRAKYLVETQMLNGELSETENAIQKYLNQSEEYKSQIERRRDAQAEMFAYVNEKLEEDNRTILELQKIIKEAEEKRIEASNQFEASEAACVAEHAMKCEAYRIETEAIEKEIKEFTEFMENRDAMEAKFVALNALAVQLERQRVEQKKYFEALCEADEREAKREAEIALEKAKKKAMADKMKKIDPALAERVRQHQRMCAELKTQRRGCKMLKADNEKKRAQIKAVQRELAAVKAKHALLLKESRESKNYKQAAKDHHQHYKQLADDAIAAYHREEEEEEEGRIGPLATPPKSPPLSTEQETLLSSQDELKKVKADIRKIKSIQERMEALETPDISALFAAFNAFGNKSPKNAAEAYEFIQLIFNKFKEYNVPIEKFFQRPEHHPSTTTILPTKICTNSSSEDQETFQYDEIVSPMSRSVLSSSSSSSTFFDEAPTHLSQNTTLSPPGDGSTIQLPRIRSSDSILQEDDASTIISNVSKLTKRSTNSLYKATSKSRKAHYL